MFASIENYLQIISHAISVIILTNTVILYQYDIENTMINLQNCLISNLKVYTAIILIKKPFIYKYSQVGLAGCQRFLAAQTTL